MQLLELPLNVHNISLSTSLLFFACDFFFLPNDLTELGNFQIFSYIKNGQPGFSDHKYSIVQGVLCRVEFFCLFAFFCIATKATVIKCTCMEYVGAKNKKLSFFFIFNFSFFLVESYTLEKPMAKISIGLMLGC